VSAGEGGEHVNRIVADGEDRDPLARVVIQFALQLNELRLAVWSPACAAIEDNRGAARSPVLVQVDQVTVLVRKQYVRKP